MPEREKPRHRTIHAFIQRKKFVLGRNYDRIGVDPVAYEADVAGGEARGVIAHLLGDRIADNLFQRGALVRVLDIAAGTGIGSRDLAERGFHVASLDLSYTMLHHLQNNSEETVRPLLADMNRRFPFQDNSFDAATSLWSNRYIKNPRRFLEETHRVLRADGVLVWPIMPSSSFIWKLLAHKVRIPTKPDELAPVATNVGFREVRIVDAYGKPLTSGSKYPVQFLIGRK